MLIISFEYSYDGSNFLVPFDFKETDFPAIHIYQQRNNNVTLSIAVRYFDKGKANKFDQGWVQDLNILLKR